MVTGTNADSSFGRRSFFVSASGLRLSAVAVALFVMGLILYVGFIFGQKTLLYKDIGVDSLNVFYPNYVLRSDYLRHHGLFSWAFQVGMGQDIFPSIGSLLITPVVWLPKQAIAKGLIYQHFFYLLLGGLFFFRFLSARGLASESCFLGAALFSFSAYMCMGSCWYFHAAEAAAFAILLYCSERAAVGGKWPYLVIGVATMSLLGVFHFYLTAIFLCLVVPSFVFLQRTQPARSIRVLFLLACAALLGVALTSVVTFTGLFGMLNSPRGLGPASLSHELVGSGMFRFESTKNYATAVLRLFSNDLAGTGSDFKGWYNYLEAPMSYCGLVCLLLLPQAFVRSGSRERIVTGFFALYFIVPTVFPWFRYLFWGFQGDYYRTFSLFGVLGTITLSMAVLSRYIRARILNLPLLLATAVLLELILLLPINRVQILIDSSLRWAVVALVAIYAAFLVIGVLLRRQRVSAYLVVATTLVELLCFDRRTIYRPTVTKAELTQRIGYNDNTVEAVHDIKIADTGFFRITKTFGSSPGSRQSLNDSMVFGYYGTSSYSSFNNLNYIKFLMAMNLIDPGDLIEQAQWSSGLLGHPLLLTFACEKYVITNEPVGYQMAQQYELFGRYGPYYAFRNNMFLPLGLVFKEYLPERTFLSLSSDDKAIALLHAIVLNTSPAPVPAKELSFADLKSDFETRSVSEMIRYRRATSLRLHEFSESHFDGEVETDGPSLLLLQMPFDPGWHATVDGEETRPFRADCGLCGVLLQHTGIHQVRMWFAPPYRLAGGFLSGVCLAFFVAASIFGPRLRPI